MHPKLYKQFEKNTPEVIDYFRQKGIILTADYNEGDVFRVICWVLPWSDEGNNSVAGFLSQPEGWMTWDADPTSLTITGAIDAVTEQSIPIEFHIEEIGDLVDQLSAVKDHLNSLEQQASLIEKRLKDISDERARTEEGSDRA